MYDPVNEAANVNAVDNMGQYKKRGRTTLKELWELPPGEKVLVSANHLGQPVGAEAQLLSSFFGMVARSSQRIGLQYETWHKVPKKLKEELLNFIESRFVLEIPKDYVLKSLGKKWRDYKHDLKKRYFKREDGVRANKDKLPEGVIRWQWEELIDHWYSNKGEEAEKVGITSRKQQKYTHTSGSKSFARKEKEMEVNSGRKIGRFEFFKETHTKKDGSHVNAETQDIMEKATAKLAEHEVMGEDETMVETQILNQIIGKERHGRVRGLGLGPTPTSYYGSSSRSTTASVDHSECIERYKDIQDKFQKIEENHQRERDQYKVVIAFLQEKFPEASNLFPDIGVSTSQSQNQSTGPEIPEANIGGSSSRDQNQSHGSH
ncbi:uncharacterized protein LOC120253540 [Dioscorea cayenensis subsp. rotundata]|uniref:Uncharacterized protein LOC120253540 n=1 Tax=Dioscorea cayennensis subsp. rotundata TaxID=55577 RepID=A0AB40ASG5_DIOCR|nr:uncharacterized protein LOC120253540 [Dioscorea cayenensis subsp. rotundata]